MKNKFMSFGIITIAMSSASQAALILVTYDFATDTAPTTIVGDALGSDATFAVGSYDAAGGNIVVLGDETDSTTIADAVIGGEYVSFIFTAGAEDVNLETISFDSSLTNSSGFRAASFPVAVFQESVGFAVGDELATNTATFNSNSVSSGDIALIGTVTAGTTEEFRFYFANNSSIEGRATNLDGFVITGESVPEPSSAVLLGLGGMALILRRKK